MPKFTEHYEELQGRPASKESLDMERRTPYVPPGSITAGMIANGALDYGLSFYAEITSITSSTIFVASGLAGKGDNFFKPTAGDPYEIYIAQADGVAPEGQHKPVLAYTTATGAFQHATFNSGNPEVGDIVLLIHPWIARTLDLYTDWKNGGRLDLLIDAIITDIASAVPEPPVAKSLQDILHKDSGHTYTRATDALEAISDDIDQAHIHVHILFVIPEAILSITADNIALYTELCKLGDVEIITQADALEFPTFGGYILCVLGTENGAASWSTDNLADLKNILGLPLLCVDNVTAAYFEIGTGGTAASKTIIKAIEEINGTKMGLGDTGHHIVTGLEPGENIVSSGATFHTLDMSATDLTSTVFCTETNDPDLTTRNEDVTMGVIRRIQTDGTIGVDEEGNDIPATLAFAGFAYEADNLTTLGKAAFYLFAHKLIQEQTQEGAIETGGLVIDLRNRLLGNMKNSFKTADPMVEYLAGKDNVGSKLPVGESLYDILLDIINDTEDLQSILGTPANFMANVSALALEATLNTHDSALTTAKAVIDAIKTILDTPANFKATGFATETKQDIIDGYHDVPSEDSASDAQMRDVIGKKSDTTGGTSLVALIKLIDSVVDAIPTTAMRGTDNVVLAGPTQAQMNTGHGLLATPAQVATALNTYDAVKRSEATDDKDEVIAAIPAMVGTNGAALASAWTAALATALGNYTSTRAGYIDNLSAGAAALEATLTAIKGGGWSTETLKAIKDAIDGLSSGFTHTDWKDSFSFTTGYGTTETDISALFSPTLALDVRRKYSVKLDLTAVETDGNFTELYLAVKEKIDGTTYRAIDRKTVTKANIAATAEPGIIIDIPATSENIQITMKMAVGLAANRLIYYAVVKEHLE